VDMMTCQAVLCGTGQSGRKVSAHDGASVFRADCRGTGGKVCQMEHFVQRLVTLQLYGVFCCIE
jgi:hypothetical protein